MTCLVLLSLLAPGQGVTVDREKMLVVVPAKVAPRKIEDEKFKEVYPVEVIATFPYPRGKKAHETVVTFDAKPSEVHAALVGLGLKPGKPAQKDGDTQEGPEVRLLLETTPGKPGTRVPVERFLMDRKTGKPMPRVKWLFTGSVMDRIADDKPATYGADDTGTLIAIFPVTGSTVFQSSLSLKDEKYVKLEVNDKLPKAGTAVNLVISVGK
ncbi:MAG: YdjY domain-containing protein [Gemmataceae bacterium]